MKIYKPLIFLFVFSIQCLFGIKIDCPDNISVRLTKDVSFHKGTHADPTIKKHHFEADLVYHDVDDQRCLILTPRIANYSYADTYSGEQSRCDQFTQKLAHMHLIDQPIKFDIDHYGLRITENTDPDKLEDFQQIIDIYEELLIPFMIIGEDLEMGDELVYFFHSTDGHISFRKKYGFDRGLFGEDSYDYSIKSLSDESVTLIINIHRLMMKMKEISIMVNPKNALNFEIESDYSTISVYPPYWNHEITKISAT